MPDDPRERVESLEAAVAHADLRVLLMVVFHLTGERRWLEPPYQPARDVRLIASEDAGLAPEVQHAIRAAAVDLLSKPGVEAVVGDPGDALMVEMMSVCLGERVPDEYAPMMREELGFASRDAQWSGDHPPSAAAERRVAVVGAGASGIALGYRLARLDIPYTIFERHGEVGGTWWENRYPGCGVDTPNHAYSFSFGERHPWSRYFAPRDEIQSYLERSARDLGVRPRIRFHTSVEGARWDEDSSRWELKLATPEGTVRERFDFLVSAIGQFGLPKVPDIPGAGRFAGPLFHSARWPAALELRGRRVALVGTGASAMQIAPEIAGSVASLTLYQRSAQWARPIARYHGDIPSGGQWLLARAPFYAEWFRFTMLWRYGDGLLPLLRRDPDWPHPERSLNRVNDRHRREMTEHIEAELGARRDLLPACVPTYPPYGKRILLDAGWFSTVARPNVELVTSAIDHVDARGIATADGVHRDADVIVLATGFEMAPMAARLGITGRGGRKLADAWANDDPRAHLGITVPAFPNFFVMQGPNAGLGHGGSAIFQSECQARYITGMLVLLVERDLASVEVRQDVLDEYVRRVDAEHEKLVWTHPGMSTYYRNESGRVTTVMPWRLVDYWTMTREPDLAEYEVAPRC